ncbi:MAG: DUF86 domain-containing protein [Anaerolineae bacterium]|nr:DUF86 domain-containing protein [Anaerolineae bacterium]
MRNLDLLRIRDLLGNIAEAQGRLRELGQLPEAEFLADYRNTESAKYLLIVATEAAIDLCNHIVARGGGRAPQDYADCFAILADLKVIRPDLAKRLKQMARFRNLLVHLYWKVDNQRVYQVIQSNLGDLDTFRQQVSAWVGMG